MIVILGGWFTCAVIAAIIGGPKGVGGTSFLLGALTGPIGIVYAIVTDGNRKSCPACRTAIDPLATICPRCHTRQPTPEQVAEARARLQAQRVEYTGVRPWVWFALLFAAVSAVALAMYAAGEL